MKKALTRMVLMAAVLFLIPFNSFAFRGPGQGGPSGGPPPRPDGQEQMMPGGNGNNPGGVENERPDLLSGVPFDITGEIISVLFPHGLEIATDVDNVIVRGLAPDTYWDELGVTPPTVGETVQVTGYIVTSPEGEDHYVAMVIVVNGQEIALRDADTGKPLWNDPEQPGPGPHPGPPPEPGIDITSGTPFDVTGQIATLLPPHGLELETAGDTLDIFGIGPAGYWDEQGVSLPEVGDTIQAAGYIVDFNGLTRYVVVSMTVNGQTIQLRDADTGEPLWRMNGQGGPGGPGGPPAAADQS